MNLMESISNQTAFSLHLVDHVSSYAASSGSNLVFSPLSLHMLISLVAMGAKGPTLAQILSILCSGSSSSDLAKHSSEIIDLVFGNGSGSGGPRLAFANGVWFDQTLKLKDEFRETVTRDFKAETKSVDFLTKAPEAASQVNSWVESVTSGLIKNLLAPGSLNSGTRLVLSNALYFKGSWAEKFKSSMTTNSEFYLLNGNTVQVPFMSSSNYQYVSFHDNFSVLKLPYNHGTEKRQFSMYIFLPDSSSGISIPTLTEKMSTETDFLTRHMPSNKIKLDKFKIPKFKISFGFEGSEIFKKLGLELMFESAGDLTEMVVDSSVSINLHISSVIHKSIVEVNEEGTVAAAASTIVFSTASQFSGAPKEFVADHPFVFLIKEETTGVILFIGHVLDPSLEKLSPVLDSSDGYLSLPLHFLQIYSCVCAFVFVFFLCYAVRFVRFRLRFLLSGV